MGVLTMKDEIRRAIEMTEKDNEKYGSSEPSRYLLSRICYNQQTILKTLDVLMGRADAPRHKSPFAKDIEMLRRQEGRAPSDAPASGAERGSPNDEEAG